MSKKIKTKYLILLGGLLIVIGVLFFQDYVMMRVDQEKPADKQLNIEFKNPSWRAQEEGISPRDAQIENYMDFPEKFPSAQFDSKTFHLLAFPQSLPIHKSKNFPDERYGNRGGLIVFSGDKEIWGSKDFLLELTQESTKFQDLTGDAIPEIITTDSGGGNVTACVMSVYKWNGVIFELITPLPDEYISPCDGSNPSNGGIKDIDNDGIFELITFKMYRVYPDADIGDPKRNQMRETELIYKFDGKKYFLWKETPIVNN